LNGRRTAVENRIAISLGSNEGAREETLLAAVSRLSAVDGLALESLSSLYETSPVGMSAETAFINAACIATTSLPPRELLAACAAVELEFGRRRGGPRPGALSAGPVAVSGRHPSPGNRTLDIDIILYGDFVIDEADLRIPHPRFHERLFVLVPLGEIGPDVRVPPSGSTVEDLQRSCAARGWVRKISARSETLNLLKTKKLE